MRHEAIITLTFPNSLTNSLPPIAPLPHHVISEGNTSVQVLPSTGNPLHPFSQDTTLAFSLPYHEASQFLEQIREIPAQKPARQEDNDGHPTASERWVMKAANNDASSKQPLSTTARNAWVGFVDLIKVRSTTTGSSRGLN